VDVDEKQKVVQYVNPFIGTANGGNTFPGAIHPWGMVSVSPHNAPDLPSGYLNTSESFYGFGHVHLSGTGCADLGSIITVISRGDIETNPEEYKCEYDNEFAEAGYYTVTLKGTDVLAEVTATKRCGIIKYTPQRAGDLNILFDVGRNLTLIGGGAVKVLSTSEVEGYNISGGFCGEDNRQYVYFAARFNRVSSDHGIWIHDELLEQGYGNIRNAPIGSWFRFQTPADSNIIVKVGISYVSTENAWQNLETEIPGWDFQRVRRETRYAWENVLSRIQVYGGTSRDRIKFYTALYHMLIHPNIIDDVNGEYPLMGRRGIGQNVNRHRYSVFSLWDTYRTLHPFLTLAYPERQSDMIKTMIDMYVEFGWLPKWELAGNETYMMVGDPASIVIADSYLKGVSDFNAEMALAAMMKPADLRPGESAPPVRAGYHQFLKYTYIPYEQDTTEAWWVWGPVSTTLEYCLADWAVARMAERLGRNIEAETFHERSLYYRNLFNADTKLMRPKHKDGRWLTPFDDLQTEGSGYWAGSGGPGFVEGHAWNYTWFVPHDIDGLIRQFGGESSFFKKLQTCFDKGYFTITNEPDIAYPYLFTYIPSEFHRTQTLVYKFMCEEFGADPDGLPGNDDAGTISAWFVFSALGFYPVCPAKAEYRLGIPLFDRSVIQLNPQYHSGRVFEIEVHGERNEKNTTDVVELNGEPIIRYRIDHHDIISGGHLIFKFK